jgi:hypothetical protein
VPLQPGLSQVVQFQVQVLVNFQADPLPALFQAVQFPDGALRQAVPIPVVNFLARHHKDRPDGALHRPLVQFLVRPPVTAHRRAGSRHRTVRHRVRLRGVLRLPCRPVRRTPAGSLPRPHFPAGLGPASTERRHRTDRPADLAFHLRDRSERRHFRARPVPADHPVSPQLRLRSIASALLKG